MPEQWLKNDLAEAKSNAFRCGMEGQTAARMASPNESAMFAEVKNSGEPSDGLTLVYLSNWTAMPLKMSHSIRANFAGPNLIC